MSGKISFLMLPSIIILSACQTFDGVFLRRLAFFSLVFPIFLYSCIQLLSILKQRSYYVKVTILFFLFSLLVKILPGGYFPPFFSGIAGWVTNHPGEIPTISLSGLKLTKLNGDEIWYSSALISPQNFLWRQIDHVKADDEKLASVMKFYWEIYKTRYPILMKGANPNQRYLGNLAYPGHNPYIVLEYEKFDPRDIISIDYVSEVYDVKTRMLKGKSKDFRFDVVSAKIERL
jgi:hypothetical protein